jgi:hypothetical protein
MSNSSLPGRRLGWIGIWLSVTVWLAASVAVLPPSATASPASPTDPADAVLFDRAKVIPIVIRVDPSAVRSLEEAPYTYVPAEVEQGGKVYPNVGLHLKGARTFQPLDRKPSITLKFNEYMPRQLFHGLRKILLNNAFEEWTFVQEHLGQELFRAVGTPAARVNYARVQLNGRDLGLYVLVEGITKDFLERHFGTAKGNLYEGVEQDIDGELEQDYGNRSRREDLAPLIRAVRERDRTKRFEQMDRCLNVDQFLGYVALEMLINVWDGYSLRCNNYRIYCDHTTGRVTFIPHGLDNYFVQADAPLLPQMRGMVSAALLDTPEGRARYIQKCREIYATLLQKDRLHQRVDQLAAVARPVLEELGLAGRQAKALNTYHKRIDRRLEFLAGELEALSKSASKTKKVSP